MLQEIMQTYTRPHTFALRDENLNQWITELEHIHNDVRTVIYPTRHSLYLPKGSSSHLLATRLRGPIMATSIYNLNTLRVHYCLDDLSTLTTTFLMRNTFCDAADPESDAHRLINTPLQVFKTLQLAVATFNDDGHEVHHVRYSGPELWRKQEQSNDWVFMRRRKLHTNHIHGGLNGRFPANVNALFKLRDVEANPRYSLAHISLLYIIVSPTTDGHEGMVRVGKPVTNHVVRVADIDAMADLIGVNPGQLYLVNNRVDVHT